MAKKNYLIFPMKVMGISQTYDGKTSHYTCSHGNPADYPIDIAGDTTGRSPFYCPCDEMKCVKIAGDITGNNHANGAWFVSTSKVDFADGTRDYVTIKFVHMNNSDFGKKGIYVGRKYKRKELIGYEGTSHASGNHIHMSAGKGTLAGSGWTKNSLGSWVITTTHGTAKPETLFFIDEDFTKIHNDKGLKFKTMPKDEEETKVIKWRVVSGEVKYKITTEYVNLRNKAQTKSGKVFFTIPKGTKVKLVQENLCKADGFVWDCVIATDENGVEYIGYCVHNYLK